MNAAISEPIPANPAPDSAIRTRCVFRTEARIVSVVHRAKGAGIDDLHRDAVGPPDLLRRLQDPVVHAGLGDDRDVAPLAA